MHTITRFVLALGALGLTACSSTDYFEEDPPVTHQPLRIVTATAPFEVEAVPVKQEMINTYTLLYVNTATRCVEAIQNVDKQDKGVEYDEASFPIEISEQGGIDRHQYKVYAFANFTPAMKAATHLDATSRTLADIKVGDRLADYFSTSIASATLDLHGLNGHDFTTGTQYIPMTAVVDYDATMQYHQPVNVPLVRMLAKLNFQVRNMTCGAEPLRLQKISIRPIQNAPVYLLPHLVNQAIGFYPERPAADEDQYGQAGSATNTTGVSYIPVLPKVPQTATDTTHVTLDLTSAPAVLPKDGTPVAVGSLYVNESLAKWHPTGHFTYDLYFIDSDGGPHEYRYALSADDFTAFLRNDNVTIPLTITSPSSLEPEVLFYPPIGGYPPVLADKADGEFYATFTTPGDFAIYPHIYREGARTDIRLTDATQVEFTPGDASNFSVTGDAGIFSKPVRYIPGDNCFKGTLGTTTGHAIINLTVRMKDSNQLVTKKIHIIRK